MTNKKKKKFSKKKFVFRLLGVVALILGILVVAFIGFSIWFAKAFFSQFDNWDQSQEVWHQANIPLANYDGEVIFEAQPAHPLLAEYNYRLRVTNNISDKSQVFNLPMNTGGQIYEPVYLITASNGLNYVEVRGVIIDLETLDSIQLNNTDYTSEGYWEEKDDREYYRLMVEADSKLLGVFNWDNGLVFSENLTVGENSSDVKNALWGDWTVLPGNIGEIRVGKINSQDGSDVDKFIQIKNAANITKTYQIAWYSDESAFSLYLFQFKNYNFLIIGDEADLAINIESLTEIEKRSMSGSIATNNIFVGSQYLTDVLQSGKRINIGVADFAKDKPEIR